MPRRATGLQRPFPVPCNLNDEENELLELDSDATGISKTELLRRAYFRRGWQERLNKRREERLVGSRK